MRVTGERGAKELRGDSSNDPPGTLRAGTSYRRDQCGSVDSGWGRGKGVHEGNNRRERGHPCTVCLGLCSPAWGCTAGSQVWDDTTATGQKVKGATQRRTQDDARSGGPAWRLGIKRRAAKNPTILPKPGA